MTKRYTIETTYGHDGLSFSIYDTFIGMWVKTFKSVQEAQSYIKHYLS